MKTILGAIVALAVIILVGVGGYYYMQSQPQAPAAPAPTAATSTPPTATTTASAAVGGTTVLGKSVQNRNISAYHFGTGSKEILVVAGLHGSYGWNTTLVAYELIDYLTAHPEAIAASESVTVIPVVNPDGLYSGIGVEGRFKASDVTATLAATVPGRYNANKVDLNRNFDCDWQAKGVWQSKSVSGGTAAFSEPESKAVQAYVQAHTPAAVVVWYSSAGGVYSSNCHGGVLPETAKITKVFADASGYSAHASFDFYATTGDMVNWLAKMKIPAISVLLTNHTDTEWSKNQAGVLALLKHYAQ